MVRLDPRLGHLRERGGCFSLLAAVTLLVLACLLGLYFGRAEGREEARTETVVRGSSSVVVAMQQLSRLEGAVFFVERVIDLKEKQSRFFQLVQAEDAILLVASGEVTAGVDLRELGPDRVRVDEEASRVVIRLPRAEVFSRRLDNERTYVHSRQTDLWAKRQEHLESRARQEAERTLEQAALDSGILRKAEESVARTLDSLVRSLGWEKVEIEFVDAGREHLAPSRESGALR